MTDLNLNRARLQLLNAIGAGKVRTSAGGLLLWEINLRQKKRVEGAVRELQEHGFVAGLLVDGQPQLTDAGRTAVAQ